MPQTQRQRATAQEWLEWFYTYADFGPADSDVRNDMKQRFMDETGKNMPDGHQFDDAGEPTLDRE